jgi:lipopolysaccharide transport system ATP-binding protein
MACTGEIPRTHASFADPLPDEAPGAGLLIVDDFFPNLLMGFRVAEFNHYLRVFPGLKIACTHPVFGAAHCAYAARYPDLADRVEAWDSLSFDAAKAVYFVFLNNAHHWVTELERRKLPFGFTLYPGGGNNLHDDVSSGKLDRVLSSPMLRGVLATQPVTLDVLRQHGCSVHVSYVPGVTVNPTYLSVPKVPRETLRSSEFRICFAAHKYEPKGVSKGYPEFLSAAAIIAARHPEAVFSVVGNFGPDDVPVPAQLMDQLVFRGPLPTMELREFFLGQDIMVAPSRRYAATGTEFDGFPTGTCVEAALCGVALICSDELNQNRYYAVGEDLLICPPEEDDLVQCMEELLQDPARLLTIRQNGRKKTVSLYRPEAQLLPRSRFLRRLALEAEIPI